MKLVLALRWLTAFLQTTASKSDAEGGRRLSNYPGVPGCRPRQSFGRSRVRDVALLFSQTAEEYRPAPKQRKQFIMKRILIFCPAAAALAAAALCAAEAAWKTKPLEAWTQQDAQQFLTDSPWVKRATPLLLPPEDEDERRESGRMGGATMRKEEGAYVGRLGWIAVRWESALPVRSAELRAQEPDPLDFDGDGYAIAVYRVPIVRSVSQTEKGFVAELRERAALRRDGRRDIKPQRVDVIDVGSNLATLLYLFPRTKAITLDDQRVDFYAQIGRLALKESFYPQVMQIEGKLRL